MDRREAILSRLFTVLSGISDFAAVYRNRPVIASAATRPALHLFDAHESRDDRLPETAFRTLGTTAIRMTPEIYISLVGAPEDVGLSVNSLRIAVLKAIFADILPEGVTQVTGSLGDLVTASGDVVYEGCSTALTMASGVESEMVFPLLISYPLKNSDFSA
jgi:hypothetical protein